MRDMTNAAVLRLALIGVFAGAAIATMVVIGQEPETLSITEVKDGGGVMTRADVQAFRDQFVAVRERMHTLIEGGLRKEDAEARIVTPELSWTQAENGLFMRRSIPGFYDEIAAER
ncbi:MAG: hypothetical protein F4Y45_16005 [Acidobacteria bacterium]|nr:hypothetical protein [Acidobacteriota bacterium]MYD72284.1 hypothetical protein [Acidobacteriota bacterium]MYJ04207.1 hypothetical protein [Acidobacteriota bacterium]